MKIENLETKSNEKLVALLEVITEQKARATTPRARIDYAEMQEEIRNELIKRLSK